MKKNILIYILVSILVLCLLPISLAALPPDYSGYCEVMDGTVENYDCVFGDDTRCSLSEFYYGKCGTEHVKELPCKQQGEFKKDYEKCCTGLKPLSEQLSQTYNSFICRVVPGGSVSGVPCLPCGNGVCDGGEDYCNCPEDCTPKDLKNLPENVYVLKLGEVKNLFSKNVQLLSIRDDKSIDVNIGGTTGGQTKQIEKESGYIVNGLYIGNFITYKNDVNGQYAIINVIPESSEKDNYLLHFGREIDYKGKGISLMQFLSEGKWPDILPKANIGVRDLTKLNMVYSLGNAVLKEGETKEITKANLKITNLKSYCYKPYCDIVPDYNHNHVGAVLIKVTGLVEGGKADLAVTDLKWERKGDHVWIYATIKNIGTDETGPFYVQVKGHSGTPYDDMGGGGFNSFEPGKEFEWASSSTIGDITGTQIGENTYLITHAINYGENTVSIIVDSKNQVEESDETNNEKSITFYVAREGECTPSWTCAGWSPCVAGKQTRICTDRNQCGIDTGKPAEEQECTVSMLCSNGVQDQDETGVDCDGPCPPCKSVVCSGCLVDDTCLSIGIIKKGKYCDFDKSLKEQKVGEESCENNFECKSNMCMDNKCMDVGFWRKIIGWFKKLFGI